MSKMKGLFIFVMLMALLLGTGFSAPAAMAQDEAFNPNAPVSDLEGALAMPEMATRFVSPPQRGTGIEAPTRIPAKDLNLPPIMAPGEELPESVIGVDSRVRVTPTTSNPYNRIAYLAVTFTTGSGSCTGWIVGPRLVVTAGHCVYDTATNKWATGITVYPGRNGSTTYGSRVKYRLFSVTGWTVSHSSNYDYGAIQIYGATFTTGTFGFRAASTFPGTFTISGYPGDKPAGTQWRMSGAINSFTTNRLYYTIDTYGGQSGSPIYQVYNSVCCYGVGIHTNGGTTSNSGTRITTAVFNNLMAWKVYAYP